MRWILQKINDAARRRYRRLLPQRRDEEEIKEVQTDRLLTDEALRRSQTTMADVEAQIMMRRATRAPEHD